MARPEQVTERFDKLSKWAQQYIVKLERDIAYVKEQRGQVVNADGAITWTMFRDDGVYGVPDDATITFKTGSGRIRIDIKNDKVRIHSHDNVLIQPTSSNTFTVMAKRRTVETS